MLLNKIDKPVRVSWAFIVEIKSLLFLRNAQSFLVSIMS